MSRQQPTRFSQRQDMVTSRVLDLKSKIVEGCEICHGDGYVPAEAGKIHRCDCMIVFRYVKALVKADLPKVPYWTLSLEELRVENYIHEFTKVYLENFQRAMDNGLGAVLLGPNGIGKTSVMVEIGKEALVRGYSVRYFTLTAYIDAVMSKNRELIDDMESGDLLLIDELDKTNADRLNNKLDRTIDDLLRRMANVGKAMILSTNWNEEELINVLGQSAVSLLRRNNKLLPMEGDDYTEVIEQSWLDRLVDDFDYHHKNITSMANRMEDSVWQK